MHLSIVFFLYFFNSFSVDFSMSIQYFLKRVSFQCYKISLTATEQFAYKNVPTVEICIMLMTIIKAKIGQNGRSSKCATLYALSGLKL